MIIPASYANGFAPRDGRPLYPEFSHGLIGNWAPCLGPTGLTLRDWSGRANHGTLTNMVPGDDWIVSDGRYSLDFDGSNDFVSLPVAIAAATWTIAATINVAAITAAFQRIIGTASFQIDFAINGLDKLILSKVSSILSSKIYQVPWRPGIAGFPSKIISINLKLEEAPSSSFFVSNNCKLIFRRRYLNNYEILLSYDQL